MLEDFREQELENLPKCEFCGEECCIGYGDVVYLEQTNEHYCSTECFMELQGVKYI